MLKTKPYLAILKANKLKKQVYKGNRMSKTVIATNYTLIKDRIK